MRVYGRTVTTFPFEAHDACMWSLWVKFTEYNSWNYELYSLSTTHIIVTNAHWLLKNTSFGKAAFSYSAVQPTFDILTSPGHWAILGNKRSGLPGKTISLPVLCADNIRRQRISNLHRYSPLRVPNHTLVKWSLGDSFLVPWEIHVRPV